MNNNSGNIYQGTVSNDITHGNSYKQVKPPFPIKKTSSFNLFSVLRKIIRLLGRFFWCCIILVTLAHFVPELREYMPQLYIFIEDVVFQIVNFAYEIVNNLIL